jgi:hypothetical protein
VRKSSTRQTGGDCRKGWAQVEEAGHNLQGDNPSGLLDALLPFLNELGLA